MNAPGDLLRCSPAGSPGVDASGRIVSRRARRSGDDPRRRNAALGSCWAVAPRELVCHHDLVVDSGGRPHYSFREYLQVEEGSTIKHEFLDGDIFAMAGGTPEHAAVAANVIATLHRQLAGSGCRVYSSNLRVRVSATGLTTYPDVTIVCGDR